MYRVIDKLRRDKKKEPPVSWRSGGGGFIVSGVFSFFFPHLFFVLLPHPLTHNNIILTSFYAGGVFRISPSAIASIPIYERLVPAFIILFFSSWNIILPHPEARSPIADDCAHLNLNITCWTAAARRPVHMPHYSLQFTFTLSRWPHSVPSSCRPFVVYRTSVRSFFSFIILTVEFREWFNIFFTESVSFFQSSNA